MKNRFLVTLCIALILVVIAVLIAPHTWQDRRAPLQAIPRKQAAVPVQAKSEQPHRNGLAATEGTAAAEQIHAGGREWALSFSDSTVPAKTRTLIAKDLNLIFGHLSVTEIDKLPFPINGQLNGNKVQLTHRVRLEGGARKGPKELMDDPFMCLVDGKAETGLYIPKEITDAYQLAIERSQKYSQAYDNLRQMMESLSHLEQRPIANVKSLFLLTDDNQSQAEDLAQMDDAALAAAWGRYKYREPSLLEITETHGTPLEKYGLLVAQIYAGPNLNEFFPLIYRNSRWQILVGRGE